MSIVPLKKVTICGLAREKGVVLEHLQALGCMHLLPLKAAPAEIEKVASPHAADATKALQFLTAVPPRRKQVRRDPDFDVADFVENVTALRDSLRDARDRRDFLQNRIAGVEPWGDIDFPPHASLAGYRLWFYEVPVKHLDSLQALDIPWQIVRRDHRVAYAILISKHEPADTLLPVRRTHTGALPLRELRARLEETEIEIEDLLGQRQALTRYIYLLSRNLAEAENRAALAHAEQQVLADDALIAVQGWVPADTIPQIEAYAEENSLACLVEDPEPDETPPTLVDQPQGMEAGTDLTMFYQVPNYRAWDPTWILSASFAVFFAMILADAGYGLVLLVGLMLFWRRLGTTPRAKGYRLLGLALFGTTIAYGVMVGSYFGFSPPPDGFLARLHLFSVDDFDTMMRLSIVIGVLHIGFANAMAAYAKRHRRSALSNLGWIAGLAGGLWLWLAPENGLPTAPGSALLALAVILIAGFSSDRPITKPSDHAWRLLDGLQSLAGMMGAFGDVLSYMRLFALGLASASLAITFNDLARDAVAALPGLGLLAGGLILLIGHALNLGLSLMSGVVHGLRLNFIEFYKWGLPEEGTAFRAFARKEVEL